jgi:glutamyl-tRNA synthetase
MNTALVRTRMAPSPTGEIHVGSMATLLKNYAFAKKYGGLFILRIEDTDQERKIPGAVERLLATVAAYGLSWDEGPDCGGQYGPYTQSERLELYQEHAQKLIAEHKAYRCFCSKERLESVRDAQRLQKTAPKYDKHCRSLTQEDLSKKLDAHESFVVRLAVPENQEVAFTDVLRGKITFNSSDGFPTYHLAVVVDDHLMKISHIMRGEEWISSTPKHILLYQAFGWNPPIYAHIPIFLNPDGKGKMSKRKGTVSAQFFLDQGYLPEALLNFFMILGWSRKDQREIMTLSEYIAEFEPKDLSAKSVVFDLQKLDWINGMYIRALPLEKLEKLLEPFIPPDFPREILSAVLPLISERLVKLSDFAELTKFFYIMETPSTELVTKKASSDTVLKQLTDTIAALTKIKNWSTEELTTTVRSLQETAGWSKKQYFMMLRVACTGKAITPPLFETITILGKEITLDRLLKMQIMLT